MIRRGALLVALAALLYGAPLQAGRVRLVLDNGYVLPLSADGSAFDGEFGKLALPDDRNIYGLEPDYPNRRLYVTLDGSRAHYTTRVYDLDTLQLAEELDDVVAVQVPDDPGARTLLSRRYLPEDARRYGGNMLALFESPGDLQWQQRDRRHPAKVLNEGRGDTAFPPLPRCHRGGRRPFLTANPSWQLDRDFARAKTGDAGLTDDRPPLQRIVLACLPGGDTVDLLYERDVDFYRRFDGHPAKWIERRHGRRSVARHAIDPPVALRDLQLDARLLGPATRHLSVPALGLVFDVNDGSVIRGVSIGGDPPWTTLSSDGRTSYTLPHCYVYRSLISETYLPDSYPWFFGGVTRSSIAGGAPRTDKLPLPAQLGEILDRQDAELEAFKAYTQRMTEAAAAGEDPPAAEAEPAEPEPTPLQRRVGRWIRIVGVLDD